MIDAPNLRDNPLVSVVVITYNDLAHVTEAIDSALRQTYHPIEVIVVDDGSSDATGVELARRYGHRIRFLSKVNGGMGSARAHGIAAARGEYIQHLDSDDLLLPEKIGNQVAFLEQHPEIAFAYGRSLCFYEDAPEKTWEHHANARAKSGNLFDDILVGGNFVNVVQPLFRRSWIDRIGGWDSDARVADDYDTMVRLAYDGASGHFLDEPVFLYRQRRTPFDADLTNPATWRSIETLARGEIRILEKLLTRMERDGRAGSEQVKRKIGAAMFSLGWGLFREGRRSEACRYILDGLKLNRERWLYKLMILFAALLLPGRQLLKLKRRFRPPHFAGDRVDVPT